MNKFWSACAVLAIPLIAGSGSAHAEPETNTTTGIGGSAVMIHSVVHWTGIDCIPIRAPQYPDGRSTRTTMFCGGYSEANYSAYPGEYVGADPQPNDRTMSIGCTLYINGYVDNSDYALPGDHHNVSCLRMLRGYDDGSAQSQG